MVQNITNTFLSLYSNPKQQELAQDMAAKGPYWMLFYPSYVL